MEQQSVVIEKKGGIAFLVLNQPETGNLLNEKLFSEISRTLEELNADEEVRLIIIKGAGDSFCMGGDVARIATFDQSSSTSTLSNYASCSLVTLGKLEARKFFLGLIKMYQTFHRIDKPSIAMVHGYATGGGMGVALSCDLIVASEDARFGSTAINTGLFCMNTSAVMLPRIVGSKKALEMGLTGDVISANEAERLGIVNMVVPRERLEPATVELAQKVLSKNPVAIVMGRRNFYTCADMEYDKALEHSAEMFALLAATEEAKEGMRAFLEKRKPRW